MPACTECGAEFKAKRVDARYCGPTCRKRATRAPKDEVASLRAEADRLVALQREHRGWVAGPVIEGKSTVVLGPYKPTAESEARAKRIGELRRQAAKLEHPLPTS